MKAWMLSVVGLARTMIGRRSPAPTARKYRVRIDMALEHLERREVMTTATVIPFASLPGQITAPGQSAQVVLHLGAGQLRSDRATSVLVGFYAEPAPGSSVAPQITEVGGAMGRQTPFAVPPRSPSPPSKALFLTEVVPLSDRPEDLVVRVSGLNSNTGNFTVRAFLPGDSNGDGTVDGTDLARVQAAYRTAAGQSNFDPQSDFNVDGHVGCIDRRVTQVNQGAHIAPAPVVAAAIPNPAPAPPPSPPAPAPSVQINEILPVPVAPVMVAAVPQAQVAVAPVPTSQVLVSPIQSDPLAFPVGQSAPAFVYGQPILPSPGPGFVGSAAQSGGFVYGQPADQGASPGYIYGQPVVRPASAGYYLPAGTPSSYYYGSSSAPAVGGTASIAAVPVSGQWGMPAPVAGYYATSAQSPIYPSIPMTGAVATNPGAPVYYYGQPVVRTSTYGQSRLVDRGF